MPPPTKRNRQSTSSASTRRAADTETNETGEDRLLQLAASGDLYFSRWIYGYDEQEDLFLALALLAHNQRHDRKILRYLDSVGGDSGITHSSVGDLLRAAGSTERMTKEEIRAAVAQAIGRLRHASQAPLHVEEPIKSMRRSNNMNTLNLMSVGDRMDVQAIVSGIRTSLKNSQVSDRPRPARKQRNVARFVSQHVGAQLGRAISPKDIRHWLVSRKPEPHLSYKASWKLPAPFNGYSVWFSKSRLRWRDPRGDEHDVDLASLGRYTSERNTQV